MTRPAPPTANSLLQNGTIRVLLIDDQPMIAEAVRRMLATEPGLEFHYCQEPQRAIVMANEIKPTVILQDLVMPEIDGQMLVKFFRANPATADTPMIVLSSKEEAVTKAEAFANGAAKLVDARALQGKRVHVHRLFHHGRGG